MNWIELNEKLPTIVSRKLEQLKFLRERPDYHPEPSCHIHIKTVTERLMTTNNIDLILSGLFHDICKFDTVRENPKTGFPTSPGHDKWAYKLILNEETVWKFIEDLGGNVMNVANICKQHMRIKQISQMKPSKQSILRELPIFPLLEVFTMADNMLVPFDTDKALDMLKTYYKTI